MNMDIIEYEYKMDVGDLDFYSDMFTQFNSRFILLNSTYTNRLLLLSSLMSK
jgi:hypothetical protein